MKLNGIPYRRMFSILSLILTLIVLFHFLPAQQAQWQWAARGGSPDQPQFGNNEYADEVEADTAGNIYVTGRIYSTNASFTSLAGAVNVTTYGGFDIFLAKFDCGGHMLWADILGSAGDDNPNGLKIGRDGKIYLLGAPASTPFTVSTPSGDSVYTYTNYSGIFVAKFNPDGSLIRFQKFDQTDVNNNPGVNYLAINSKDNPVILFGAYPGNFTSNLVIHDTGFVYSELDTALQPLWIKTIAGQLGLGISNFPKFTTFVLDNNDNIFFAGSFGAGGPDTVEWGGQKLIITPGASETALIIKFDSSGNYLWHRKGTSPHGDAAYYPTLDASGNLIVFVATIKGDTVLGFPLNYSGNSIYEPAFVKLSGSDGSLMYGIVGNNNSTLTFSAGSALKYGFDHNLYFVYQLAGNVIFDSISLITSVNNGEPLVWEFKDEDTAFRATDNYTLLTGSDAPGDNQNAPYWFTTDQQGNWYIVGPLNGSIYTSGDTIQYANGGGQTDIFVAKYGLSCGDTNALIPPLAPNNLVATATGPHAITATWQNNTQYIQRFRIYRSTDSAIWTVVDSVPANITTYIDMNAQQNVIYWYKASAVNNAGESQFTNSDSAEIISSQIAVLESSNIQMLILPNPNKGAFTLAIASSENSNAMFAVYSMDGKEFLSQPLQITQGNNWYPVNMLDLSGGVYIAQISSSENGIVGRIKFVVE